MTPRIPPPFPVEALCGPVSQYEPRQGTALSSVARTGTTAPADGQKGRNIAAGGGIFAHPIHGLPVMRSFSTQARALLPAAILADPAHPWLQRQERSLPKGVLGVVYYRDCVELVMPQGVTRRPFVGEVDLCRSLGSAPPPEPPTPLHHAGAEAERVKAWRAANREKVKAQSRRQAERRRAARTQLREAAAASNRSLAG